MAFVDAPLEFRRTNLFVDISGEEKTGKTTLALTARPTINVIDMNDGLDGVVQKVVARRGKGKIKIAYHPLPQFDTKDKMREAARKTWDALLLDVKTAALTGGTVFFDGGTELYKLARYAEFGDVKTTGKKGALDYDAVNSRMRGLFHLFHAHKANFILTHQVREEWKRYTDSNGVDKSKTTGKLINNGWEDTGYDIQIALRTYKRIDVEGLHFGATLTVCRFEPKYEGTQFEDDLCNLPYIMGFVTDTEEGMWQ